MSSDQPHETSQESDEGFSLELQDRISRQLGTFGFQAVGKLMKMRVLISGMTALGVETAKNLILAGPKSVTVHDNTLATKADLGANYFLREDDIGTARGAAVVNRLAELNDFCKVSHHDGDLSTEFFLANFDVVVITEVQNPAVLSAWNEACRAADIGFIVANSYGLSGFTFVDFGDNFMTFDRNGVPPRQFIVTNITQDEEGVVSGVAGSMHGLSTGDYVKFTEVEGMTELNDAKPIRITAENPYEFTIGDTRNYSAYTRQGMATEVKMNTKLPFASFAESRDNPYAQGGELVLTDFGKFGRANVLHIAYQALWSWQTANGDQLPEINNADQTAEVVKMALELNETNKSAEGFYVDDIEQLTQCTRYVAMHARCQFSPLASFFGGVVAQEIVKFTGKYTPIRQWLYFDAFELEPNTVPDDVALENTRYDHQIAVWGKSYQERLKKLRVFLVGAGALGCEYLKGFAMMGVGCGQDGGHIAVTDNDTIEVSNLNRQFLFRMHNVGKTKSESASKAVQEMNPELNCQPYTTKVAPDTEDVFNDHFWMGIDLVQNALDNVKARQYVDGRCTLFGLPLLESGTLGTKANAQVCLPGITASYTDSGKDPEEENIPMCTLRNFPSKIEHCCEWARANFEDRFAVAFQETNNFLAAPQEYVDKLLALGNPTMAREKLEKVDEVLANQRNMSLETCVELAVHSYLSNYRDRILQLTHLFPKDAVDKKTGDLFWSGDKRFPDALEVNVEDETTLDYLIAAANLYAHSYRLEVPEDQKRDRDLFAKLVSKVDIPEFKPKTNVRVQTNPEDETEEGAEDDEEERNKLAAKVLQYNLDEVGDLDPADFEKDDDSNFHIDFISACSNLRARCYRLQEVTRHRTKMIAGKIIPAVATTTAMIAGVTLLEFYKVFATLPMEAFKNTYVDLGTSTFQMYEPNGPTKAQPGYDVIEMCEVKCVPDGFTNWDHVDVVADHSLTLGEFKQAFADATGGLTLTSLLAANATEGQGKFLYDEYGTNASDDTDLLSLYEQYYGPVDKANKLFLLLDNGCTNADDEPCKTPFVRYFFQGKPE